VVDFTLTPARTALVNVDMQNCFVEGYPNTPQRLATLGRINQLAAACRAAGIPVIHTSHILRPDGSNIGILGEVVPRVRLTGFGPPPGAGRRARRYPAREAPLRRVPRHRSGADPPHARH